MNLVLVAVIATSFSACNKSDSHGKSRRAGRPIPTPVVEGIVKECTNAEHYTYFRLKMQKEERWVAVPETDLSIGEKISVFAGAVMTNHHNKALGRTFDAVYFSPGLSDGRRKKSDSAPCALVLGAGKSSALPAGHSPVSGARGGMGGGVPVGVFTGRVVEVRDVPGYTYVQVVSGTNGIWAAAPQFSVSKGDKVTVSMAMAMRDFTSSTLKKSFAVLYMVEDIPVLEKAAPSK